MDRYTARMTQYGTTQRERIVNRLKTNLNNKLQDNPSYKSVKLNGKETHLIINTSTKPYYKEFQSLPDQKILAGDYVEWADSMWLVLNADSDDEVYTDGNLRQCQHCIYWQKSDGTIVSRYAYTENASAYNNGEAGNHTITLQSNQFMVYLPYDEETAELDNGKRVHMSRSNSKCKPYELTRPDDVTYGFGKKGVLNIIFTQTQYNQGNDKLITLEDGTQAWICDYIDSSSTHLPPQPSTPDETEDLWEMKINCPNLEIKPTGYPKTLTATLYNTKTGETIPDIVYEWNVQSSISEFISYTVVDNVLKISLSKEYEDFGDEITITCNSKYTGQQETVVITTKGVF